MQKEEPRRLCFNFKRIRKKEVYQAFLEIYAHGGIELNNQELISFLARHTNLGSEASITTLFYRYKQHVHVWLYKLLVQHDIIYGIYTASMLMISLFLEV